MVDLKKEMGYLACPKIMKKIFMAITKAENKKETQTVLSREN